VICVYAITAGRPTRTTRRFSVRRCVGRLTAIVADVRRAPEATPPQLRKYHQLIAGLAAMYPALIPAQFGTMMQDGELVMVLQSRTRSLSDALRHVRGRVQMTIRIAGRDAQASRARTLPLERPSSGAEYLRERARQAAIERDVNGFGPVRQAIERWVRDERVEVRSGVTSVYHLVPRHSVAAYRRAATAAAEHAALRVIITGPFPPYAFSSI
jgi:hypothetical protein